VLLWNANSRLLSRCCISWNDLEGHSRSSETMLFQRPLFHFIFCGLWKTCTLYWHFAHRFRDITNYCLAYVTPITLNRFSTVIKSISRVRFLIRPEKQWQQTTDHNSTVWQIPYDFTFVFHCVITWEILNNPSGRVW